jgi:cytochrome c553
MPSFNNLSALRRLAALLPLLVAGAATAAAPPPARLPDTMAQRLVPCLSCHARTDADGRPLNDRFFPRIAGKPAGYLYNQLVNFRDGRRQFPVMTYMVDHLSDPYLLEIAGWFADQHPPAPSAPPVSAAPALLARGRQLALQGDLKLKVPACIACHGERLTGVAPAVPGLLGLPRDYINAQLGAWRNKTRRAHAPDCMAVIAERLSLEDVAAVSTWLASQPLPADARPATTVARPLPLACGSSPDPR